MCPAIAFCRYLALLSILLNCARYLRFLSGKPRFWESFRRVARLCIHAIFKLSDKKDSYLGIKIGLSRKLYEPCSKQRENVALRVGRRIAAGVAAGLCGRAAVGGRAARFVEAVCRTFGEKGDSRAWRLQNGNGWRPHLPIRVRGAYNSESFACAMRGRVRNRGGTLPRAWRADGGSLAAKGRRSKE